MGMVYVYGLWSIAGDAWKMQYAKKCTGRKQDKEMRRIMKEHCFASLNAKMQKCSRVSPNVQRKETMLSAPAIITSTFLYRRLF